MPSYTDLIKDFDNHVGDKSTWLQSRINDWLSKIAENRGGKNVIFYYSGFLQKPTAQPVVQQITHEDINGLMAVIHGMDCSKGLTLLLHTPGGVTVAAETIVSYLRSKFTEIEVIVPALAMSAGTMISLAADKIVLGKPSQLGPIDPQMPIFNRIVSSIAILDQFERAKSEIKADKDMAHVWAPILQSLGPALLQECENAIKYSEDRVADWLSKYMFKDHENPVEISERVTTFFSRGDEGNKNNNHGRRIDINEAIAIGLNIEALEGSQILQEAVLTSYHLLTLMIEKSNSVKIIVSNDNKYFTKNI